MIRRVEFRNGTNVEDYIDLDLINYHDLFWYVFLQPFWQVSRKFCEGANGIRKFGYRDTISFGIAVTVYVNQFYLD